MTCIPLVEGPVAAAIAASVVNDRVHDYVLQQDQAEHAAHAEHAEQAAAREVDMAAAATAGQNHASSPLSEPPTSGCTSVERHRSPAIEVVAIHRETPEVSPASFSAHYEAAVHRLSGVSTPLQDVGASVPRLSEGGESVDIAIDVIVEAVSDEPEDEAEGEGDWVPATTMETAEYVVTEVVEDEAEAETEEQETEEHETEVEEEEVPPQRFVSTAAVTVEQMYSAREVESDLSGADENSLAALEDIHSDTDGPFGAPPREHGAESEETPATDERAAVPQDKEEEEKEDDESAGDVVEDAYEEIPIHESETAQFILIRPRRSSGSGSANSPMRASGSTAPARGSTSSRHDSPSQVRAARLPRSQSREVTAHPCVLVRRSSSSADTNSNKGGSAVATSALLHSSGGGTFMTVSGQNSAGSNNADTVNLDEWSGSRRAIPSASSAASPQFQHQHEQQEQKEQESRTSPPPSVPPLMALSASLSPAAARHSVEGRIMRGPSEQQAATRAAPPPSQSRDALLVMRTRPSQSHNGSEADGQGRRRLGSVSVVEVDQASQRQSEAAKDGASQETIKAYIYVLMEQHGSTVRVWEERVHTAEVYRDKPLRTGGRPDPLRASDVGFLERANHTLGIHHDQLVEAHQLLHTQLQVPAAQRAQPKVVVRSDPRSPLSAATQATAWTDYCQRFCNSLDDLLVQTDYLQHRVEGLLHPPMTGTPRHAASRASSMPATPRSARSTRSASTPRRSLQPPPPAKDFTWRMPTRATSRPRRGSAISSSGRRSEVGDPRGAVRTPRRSQVTSRASSVPTTPRGQTTTTTTAAPASPISAGRRVSRHGDHVPAQSTSGVAPPTSAPSLVSSPTAHASRASLTQPSRHGSRSHDVARASVQRGSQEPIAPGYRSTTTPVAATRPGIRTDTQPSPSSSSSARLGVSAYDMSTPYGQLPGTPRRSSLGRGASGSQTPTGTPPPTSPLKSPTSPATSPASKDERMAMVTELAAMEARAETLQRDDLKHARDIFMELYGTEAGPKQYANWMANLAANALQSA